MSLTLSNAGTAKPSKKSTPGRTWAPLDLALIAGFLSAALSYACCRVVQKFFFPDPDPRVVLFSGRIAFFWRGWVSLFCLGLVMIGTLAACRRWGTHRCEGWVLRGVWWVCLACALQGLLLP